MLPIIPRVTKLNSKTISKFAGIDTRHDAKDNSFFSLKNVDIDNGASLYGSGNFLHAQYLQPIKSNNILAIKNDTDETDIYYLGEGGFYKNGELLPFYLSYLSFDMTWIQKHTRDIEIYSDGTCKWVGDYQETKLVRYGEYIFAIPQMIATDGNKTFFWNRLTCGCNYASNTTVTDGILRIGHNTTYLSNMFGSFQIGDVLDLFIDDKLCTGSFTVVSNDYMGFRVKCIDENGEFHTNSTLGLNKSGSAQQNFAIRHKNIPDFSDAIVAYNRIWGVSGNRVYASKLANPFAFNAETGNESDAWWADTEDSSDFVAIGSLNGRLVAFKKTSTYEIYGTVNPFTIKDVSRSLGCIDKDSLCEVNGVLFLLTTEGVCVYGGSKFVNINEKINITGNKLKGIGIGSKFYCLKEGGVYKYDYYTDMWVNICDVDLKNIMNIFGDLFALCQDGTFLQLSGSPKSYFTYTEPLKREWEVESVCIGGNDFYSDGINKMELRFESDSDSDVKVEISRDGNAYEHCGEVKCKDGWQIYSLPISFKPCSSFKYKISGSGSSRLRLIKYFYRKGGNADLYE